MVNKLDMQKFVVPKGTSGMLFLFIYYYSGLKTHINIWNNDSPYRSKLLLFFKWEEGNTPKNNVFTVSKLRK